MLVVFLVDWEQRKLGEVYRKIRNAFVGTASPYYVKKSENGHFYLESNNVKDGQINHKTEVYINSDFYERQKDKLLKTGNLVMVQSGHVGHTAVIPPELNNTAAHALIMFQDPFSDVEPYFLNYSLQTYTSKSMLNLVTTGNTIKHILASDMKKFNITLPSFDEQSDVAKLLKTLDELITLHQRINTNVE